ncbi:unnamed protein product [Boreogadus saida]
MKLECLPVGLLTTSDGSLAARQHVTGQYSTPPHRRRDLHPQGTSTKGKLHPQGTTTKGKLHPQGTSTKGKLHPQGTSTKGKLHPQGTSTKGKLHPQGTSTQRDPSRDSTQRRKGEAGAAPMASPALTPGVRRPSERIQWRKKSLEDHPSSHTPPPRLKGRGPLLSLARA